MSHAKPFKNSNSDYVPFSPNLWVSTETRYGNLFFQTENIWSKLYVNKLYDAIFTVLSCKGPILASPHVVLKIKVRLVAQNATERDGMTKEMKWNGISHLKGQQHSPCNSLWRQLVEEKQSSLSHTSQLVGIFVMQHYKKLALAPYVACD